MAKETSLEMSGPQAFRERARELANRHGEHAEEYVKARIEASEIAGKSGEADGWRQILILLD